MEYNHAIFTTSMGLGFALVLERTSGLLNFDRPLTLGINTNREPVIVVEAICADGYVLLPMVIVSGIIHQERWFTTTLTTILCLLSWILAIQGLID
jgi:hypothetical protein